MSQYRSSEIVRASVAVALRQLQQFQQPLVVGMMAKQGGAEVPFDVEGSGYGFKIVRQFKASEVALPSTCKMSRPAP